MGLLLFILGISFFYIFFAFSQNLNLGESFFPNIFYEANIYILLSCVFIFFAYSGKKFRKSSQEEDSQKGDMLGVSFFKDIEYKKLMKIFFERYMYLLAIILFYTSLSFFLRNSFEAIQTSHIFLLFNVVVIALFFLEDRFQVFRDLLRINTLVISLYYLFLFAGIIFGISNASLSLIDTLNIATLYILFGLFIYKLKRKFLSGEFYTYMLLFVFFHCLILGRFFMGNMQNLSYFVSFFFSTFLFLVTTQVSHFLSVKISYVRVWGILFAFLSILLGCLHMFESNFVSFLILAGVGGTSTLLYCFHRQFENYIALGFSFFGVSCFLHYIYHFFSTEHYRLYVGIFLLILSFGYLVFYNIQKIYSPSESYFIHVYSLGVNMLGVILFFLFYDLSVLSISVLLMIESIYLFGSYFSFRKGKKG